MKISKIEKKRRLYLVEIDESDKLYVTEDTIIRFMLTKGKDITEEELADILTFAQFSYGKNLALYYLSFRQRTKREIRDYLLKYEIEESYIPQILADLEKNNWGNDEIYAKNFIQGQLASGDKGAYVLKQKLGQKGISSEILDRLLAEADFSPVAERVAEKLLRKYQTKLPPKALESKITQSLVNKGFSYSEAKTAFLALELEEDEEETMDLLYKELDKQYRKYSRKYEGYELKQRLIQALARKGYDFSDISTALKEYL